MNFIRKKAAHAAFFYANFYEILPHVCISTKIALLPMVVDHADALQVGIDDRGADELEPSRPQGGTHSLGKRVLCGHFADIRKMMIDRLPLRKAPDEGIETAEFLLYLAECTRVADRGLDLLAVALALLQLALIPERRGR